MEAPIAFYINKEKQSPTGEYFQNPSIFSDKKEYIISIDNDSYKLIISYNKNEINLTIEKINNEILLFDYNNKYNYKDILSLLKLPSEIYVDSKKIVDLIDKAYENKKLSLKFNDKKTEIFLIIKITIGFDEIDCPIKIKRYDYNIEEKFDVILNEMKTLRQNKNILINSKLLEIEKTIQSLKEFVKNKLNENLTFIDELKQKIEKNKKMLDNNKNEIELLKSELLKLEEREQKIFFENKIKNKDKDKQKDKEKVNKLKQRRNDVKIIEEFEPDIKEIEYKIKKLKFNEIEKEDFIFTIIIDGDQKTGKTSIIEKFTGNNNSRQNKSFGNNINFAYIEIDKTIIKLEIIDFEIKDFNKRFINEYKKADIIMFIYSINDSQSFEKVKNKIALMRTKKYLIFLIGNKSDLERDRKILEKDVKEIVNEYNINYFTETSAETGKNIDEMFYEAVKILYKNKKPVKNNAKIMGFSKANEGYKNRNTLKFFFPS